jgi:hypothetical protein
LKIFWSHIHEYSLKLKWLLSCIYGYCICHDNVRKNDIKWIISARTLFLCIS